MPSIKDLRKRIGSVKNTQQTTKAMKMVSAAKLRRAQEAITEHRPYAKQLSHLMGTLSAQPKLTITSPYLGASVVETGTGLPRVFLLVVTSDRGLCGGFNSGVLKTAQKWIAANKDVYSQIRLGFVGRKGNEFFRARRGANAGLMLGEVGGKVTFASAKGISNKLAELFTSGQVDEVKILFNEFKNAASQKPLVQDYLPIRPSVTSGEEEKDAASIVVRPGSTEILTELIEKNLVVQVYRILLESLAGEHGARMSAMENATKNAGEMIRKLTLQYNKQRQAGITKELLEIIAGSESQKAS